MITSFKQSTWRTVLVVAATVCTLMVASPASAKKIGSANMPDSVTIGTEQVPLVGGGLRTRAVFKLYAAALYANESGEGKAVADADAPMAIHLHILSKLVNKNKMVAALKSGFKNSTGGDTSGIQDGIDKMIGAMNAGSLERGVAYTLVYEPGVGTIMTRNGLNPVVIEGLEFKQALFGIWIGDKPAQANLKNRMLGK